ncbi:3'-5' exonuclease [Pedobacter sp. KR3-3]|uniref:3'-5' exonuclease n=1 Tax=Pedobacter albus TaxID=3113905 RepID=A0ABU7IB00_9SPHI|nr:3'-5' exonuclease [Pedobacter sp. KR3-3]MEE1946643.1 3'-5' exonuclease [Pedobacter sp. KR3-3]
MYLFFDTETTGLPKNWKAAVTDLANWPRLVQLAYLYFNAKGELIASGDFIVRPEGFIIPKESSDIHGITTERAINEGLSLKVVLENFYGYLDSCTHLVAHNMSFDEKIMGAELLRNNMKELISQKSRICTMLGTKNYCALPGPYGYKWPKLSELHYKLFGSDFMEAHNAAADIQATARCFWELRKRRLI